MQSTILLLESQPEIRGRVMGAQGTVNGLGHLIGGSEIGAIATAGATRLRGIILPVSRKPNALGAAQCSLCGVWWVGFNQLPAGNILRA